MKNKSIIISHKSDIDGRLGRELFCYLAELPVNTETLWIEYGKDEQYIGETAKEWAVGKDVFILDFAVSQGFFNTVAKYANNVQLFDHHTGSMKIQGTKVVDTNESTVSLLWSAFGMGPPPKLVKLARLIDIDMIHDRSLLKHKLFLDSIFMEDRDDKQEQMLQLLDNYQIPEKYELLEREHFERVEALVEKAKFASIEEGVRVVIVERPEADRDLDTDIVANTMLSRLDSVSDVDFAIVYFTIPNVGFVYSVRKFASMPSSLEEFTKSFGGGGRETAGAFRLDEPLDI